MAEKSHHGKCQKTQCWKLTEWKKYTIENVRRITPWKMEENSSLENNRIENAHLGKWQKINTLEKARKIMTGNCQNGKCTPWKMTE